MAAKGVTVTNQTKSAQHKATDLTFRELNWLLIISIVVAIFIPSISNFLGWDEKELFDQRQWILSWYYSICIVIGLIAFVRYGLIRLATDRYNIYLLIGIFSFFSSILLGTLGGAKVSPMSVMAPFFTVLIFHVFPRTNTNINLFIVRWVLIVFLLSPLLVFFLQPLFDIPFELYRLDSFRGFSDSRTDYGYLVGIAILMLVIRPAPIRFIFLPAMFFILVLSESRAALLSVIIAAVYLLTALRYKGSTAVVWAALLVGCFYLLAIYFDWGLLERGVTLFEDTSHRKEIFTASFQKAFDNILFGSGAFYQNVYVSSIGTIIEPHNSVLQSILNFGVIPTIFWFLIVGKAYFSFNAVGRAFLLYWLIFGLFHPGYDAFLFSPESFIPLLLAVHFGTRKGEALRRWKFVSGARSPEVPPILQTPR